MRIVASQLFDFLEQHATCTIERYEINSARFGALRGAIRQIVLKLRESDDQDALDASDRLRALLSEWLTVPVPFDKTMVDHLVDTLGPVEAVRVRWGSDIGILYESACDAVNGLSSGINPMRERLLEVVRDLMNLARPFKIYCHRQSRIHFESIFDSSNGQPLPENVFLHSIKDYRETGLFDVLLKVGPLRPRGWGSAPDSLLTAPHYCALVHFVWAGCANDPDFGYDPVSPPEDNAATGSSSSQSNASARSFPVKWDTLTTRVGADPGGDDTTTYEAVADDLRIFQQMNKREGMRPATLVQIDEERGILYPPHSQVLSFSPGPTGGEPVCRRLPGETLHEGMFVIIPVIDDVDLGGVRAKHGHYSRIWKFRLQQEWQSDAAGLIQRLREAGLQMVHMDSAIRRWCEPPSTVIHAPQQIKHFEILLRVLRVDDDADAAASQVRLPFWKLAWNEVRRSRGEAIQAGVQEHEIVEEQLLEILGKLVPEIRKMALQKGEFHMRVPDDYGIEGDLFLFRVSGIESGFTAPDTEFRAIRELNIINQWRS